MRIIEGNVYQHIDDDFPLERFLRALDECDVATRHASALTFVNQWHKAMRRSVVLQVQLQKILGEEAVETMLEEELAAYPWRPAQQRPSLRLV